MTDEAPGRQLQAAPEAARERRFLTFRIDQRRYALPAEDVAEIILLPPVARLPHSPKCLLGLGNLRGTVLPLVDPRQMLDLTAFAPGAGSRGIVLAGSTPVALAVDAVNALIALNPDQMETAPAMLAEERGEKLLGAFPAPDGQGAVKVLDLAAMLTSAFRDRPGNRPGQARVRRTGGQAAANGQVAEAAADEQLLLSFAVAGQDYALALGSVREIVPLPDAVSRVPRAEAVLLGVISYRDSLLPLLSLRGLLGFAALDRNRTENESHGGGQVIVLLVGGVLVGLVADRVRAIIRADASQIDAAPPMLAARTGGEARISSIFRGDGGRHLVSVLAPETLFREDVMRRLGSSEGMPSPAPETATETQGQIARFVVFRLGDEEFALPISAVDEVARVPDTITRVPKTPKFLEGVINLRGEVLPVVDQRRRFEMPKFSGGAARRLIVVHTERHRAGLIVDSVSEVLRWPENRIEPPPNLAHEASGLIDGVINVPATGRMILLLDPSELLTRAETGALDKLDLDDMDPADPAET